MTRDAIPILPRDIEADRARLLTWSADADVFLNLAEPMDHSRRGLRLNALPTKARLRAAGLGPILKGWRPARPLIHEDTRVLALGGCFAGHFVLWLADHGFNQQQGAADYDTLARYPGAFQNAAVIAHQFKKAFDARPASGNGVAARRGEDLSESDAAAAWLRAKLQDAGVAVVTLGTSEVWYDRVTGDPLDHAISFKTFDPVRFEFRVLSVADTVDALLTIEQVRARYVPELKIIYVVSPVRLAASFRLVSALTANVGSKAIIRAALDEFLRDKRSDAESVYSYFPAYEIVTEVFHDPFEGDNQHLRETVVSHVLSLFGRYYTSVGNMSDDGAPGDPFAADYAFMARIKELEARIKALQEACDARQGVIAGLQARSAALEETCDARQQAMEQIEGRNVALQRACDEREQLIAALEARGSELRQACEARDQAMAAVEARNTVLQQACDEREKLIAALQQRTAGLYQTCEERGQTLVALEARNARLQQACEERAEALAALGARNRALQQACDERGQALAALEARDVALQHTCDERGQMMSALEARNVDLQRTCDERGQVMLALEARNAALQQACDERGQITARLEDRNRELQRACDERGQAIVGLEQTAAERSALIDGLQATCDDRQALIEHLQATCDDRQGLIERLQATCDERQALIERLQAICEDRQALIERLDAR
jgi:hypothetical protein